MQPKDSETLSQILQVLQGINTKLPLTNNEQAPISFNDIVKDAVSMHVGENGEYDGILVRTLDHEFILALNDYFKGCVVCTQLKTIENPWRLPSKREVLTILLYSTEIAALLDRFGKKVNDEYKYWIEPLDSYFRMTHLAYSSDVERTTSTAYQFFVRCVKDVESKKTNKNGSGTCC